jgi:hypothetical protein
MKKLLPTSVLFRADHWEQFKALSAERGLNASANLRQLIAEYVRKTRAERAG